MSDITVSSQRRYDLDWLRIFVIAAIFIFHSGRFFDQMEWHVKSANTYAIMQAWTMFLASWVMPLIFVISGASLFYSSGSFFEFYPHYFDGMYGSYGGLFYGSPSF